MKRIIYSLGFLLFFITTTFGQLSITAKLSHSPKYLWAKNAGGTDEDVANSVITDSNGNVIIVGTFQSPTILMGSTTLTNAGLSNIFLAKYDASGNILWARSTGGTTWYNGSGVITDKNDNIYIVGSNLISKYDPLGNVIWTKTIGISTNYTAKGVATDTSNNVIVTGYITGGSNNSVIFIVKYDTSGNILWTKQIAGTDRSWSNGISTDKNDNIFVAGAFTRNITIGTTTLTNSTSGGFYSDIVVLKFDPLGNFLWAKTATGNDGYDDALSVATDSNGNAFVTGYFKCSYLNLGNTTLINNSEADVFLIKYDPSGNVVWAKSAGGRNDDSGNGVSCDVDGNAIITGYFISESISFGNETLNNESNPRSDIFVAKYDTKGNVLWVKSAGGTEDDRSNCISVDVNGNSIIAGQFGSPSISFGTNLLEHILTGSGTSDIFVAKLDYKGGLDISFVDSDWAIYPNPSNGIFYISNRTSNISNLEIYNVLGEKIYALEFSSDNIEINFNNMPKGFYFITLTSDKQRMSQKLILSR